MIDTKNVRKLISLAIQEDLPSIDLTSFSTLDSKTQGTAQLIAKEGLVFCGSDILSLVQQEGNFTFNVSQSVSDGEVVLPGSILGTLTGSLYELLAAERTILNFIQRMSGVATFTRNFVEVVGPEITVLDTRKTVPGWRMLDKYSVVVGGAKNHRVNLSEMVLVKNNHIDAHPQGIEGALNRLKERKPPYANWEVEVRDLNELKIALKYEAPIIMLDNFADSSVVEALQTISTSSFKPFVEVSGQMTAQRAKVIVEISRPFGLKVGVSVGALTNGSKNVDISMRIRQ